MRTKQEIMGDFRASLNCVGSDSSLLSDIAINQSLILEVLLDIRDKKH